MSIRNAIEALSNHEGDYDPELSAHVTAYQSGDSEVTLELEFVDPSTGDYDRTERYTLTITED